MDNVRKLNNSVAMPSIGFGTYLIKDGKDAFDSVSMALDAGYRHIDTAAIYKNEQSVGEAIDKSGLPRDQIFITTKLWNDDIRNGKVEDGFYKSRERLGLEYIDLYLIHWPAVGYVDAWLVMEDLYRQGLIKAIGISNFQKHHIDTLMEKASITPTVNQIECHPLLSQKTLRDYCAKKKILPESWSPLGGTGAKLLENEILQKLAKKHGKTAAQIVLRWIIQLGMSVNPKSEHKSRIQENHNIFDFALDEAEMQAINGLNKEQRFGPDPDHFDF